MGFLTTVTIYNDALGEFEKNPKEFAEALFDGIALANRNHREASVPFMSYANYISVQPSRHADDHTLYLHSGNCLVDMNPYGSDFKAVLTRSPELAQEWVDRAKRILKDAQEAVKKAKKGK